MDYYKLSETIFRCILLIPVIYHVYKREFRYLGSIILIFALSFLSYLSITFLNINIDLLSNCVYLIFIFMALYLGSCRSYYDKYSWWDRSIHFLSGIAFTGFGIAITNSYFKSIKWGILLFSFCFSITLHVFWELLEYITDCLIHSNAQRWQLKHTSNNHISDKAIQPAGLVDTMNDLICCIVGSMLSILIWWFII